MSNLHQKGRATRPNRRRGWATGLLILGGILWGQPAEERVHAIDSSRPIGFNREIRPILSENCYACHGPDAGSKKIRLRLDTEAGARADLGRGRRAIVPGAPERSEMIRRITHRDEALRMPPVDSPHRLTEREITLLTEWIRQGAPWEAHWAFVRPQRPTLPRVSQKEWVRNEIDTFVLSRLEEAGLRPSPEADRATLLRRLSFDLTGLPPTTAELDAFLTDTSPNAYEKVVDRLLASPRYGERMAFKWLDAARYADTNGYQIDGERFMWRWRDWVIDAFNRDMPFDQFTIEQLAGDLLPNPTMEQRIATAFNRNHRLNSEDGIVPEEYQVEYVVDRVDTTATVFLGLTMGCARCHTHKYDPLSHEEYYRFYAYFNSIPEDGRAHNFGNSPPWIPAPTEEQQKRLAELDREIGQLRGRLREETVAQEEAIEGWARGMANKPPHHWFPTRELTTRHAFDPNRPIELLATVDHIDMARPDESLGTREKLDLKKTGFREGIPTYLPSPLGEGAIFDGRIFFDAGNIGNFNFRDRLVDYQDHFAISAWFRADSEESGAIVTRMKDGPYEKDGKLPKARGYGLFLIDGKLHFNLVGVWADDSYRVETIDKVSLGEWHHVVAIFDSQRPFERAQIYLDGQRQALQINNGRLFRTFNEGAGLLRIGGGGGPEYRFRGAIDEVRIYKVAPDEEALAILAVPDSIQEIVSLPRNRRSEGQQRKLIQAWLAEGAPKQVRLEQIRLEQLLAARRYLESTFPTVMVMEELSEPRPTYLLRRGAYDLPGERVERGLPAVLTGGTHARPPANRLELARWLVSPENPLTARVTVNRFWQTLFGTGIVKSVEDFGLQGERPSHPDLLDWLAIEWMEGGGDPSRRWSVKHLLKTIVSSATYRQDSRHPAEGNDPENRLLARGPRLRLSAEMIRDQALLAAGLLVERVGGPSVKPYQPLDLLKDMVFSNMTRYTPSEGDGLWRRSLYSHWKRTILNPTMQVFDASPRELCAVRDVRTNTPLQALNLMNDVTYLEAARLLAERMLREGGSSVEERLAWGFRTLTSRPPAREEQQMLRENWEAQFRWYRQHPKEARQLLEVGERRNGTDLDPAELAGYALTASLMLNLDETITNP
jgi:hypothetical protein